MGFQPPAELEGLRSFGEVVSWAITAWAPPDGPRSIREMAGTGLARESNTVATGDAGMAVNNHAKWYVLLGQSGLESFRELSRRERDRSWRNAEREARKVTGRWFESPGAGMAKVDDLARGLLLPAEVAAWIRDRRRSLGKTLAPLRPVPVGAAVEATRNLVRDHRIFDSWLPELRSAITAPASWQPSRAQDIPRLSLPVLTRQPLTVVSGDMGSGKSRYIRQQLARYVQNVREAGPVRRIVPLILEAEQLTGVVADPDPWASAVRAFLVDHSAGISIEERDRLADLLVSRSRSGDIDMIVACDGLDELPHAMLLRLLDQASGPISRFLQAESASVILGVRSGTDAEGIVRAFADNVTGNGTNPVRVSALTRRELTALAQAWDVRLPPHRLGEFLTRHPTALLAACALATGAIEQNDSRLLESVVQRLLAGEWKIAAEVSAARMDAALAAAAGVAYAMAADQAEWRYSAPAAWVRREVTAVAGEAVLTVVERLLPRLLQRHEHEVTWVHAAVQEFLVGWHLGNQVPGAQAGEFLRRRWWQHAQWRRVTVHTVACARDPLPLLGLLADEARTDPFAVLDRLILECASVAPMPVPVRKAALARLRLQAKAMVPISRRLDSFRHSPPDGLERVPELLRSLGADAFSGFVKADFLVPQSGWKVEHHNSKAEPVRYHLSPLFLSALRAGVPVAVQLFRQCAGLAATPAMAMTTFNVLQAAEIVAAAAPWIETTELHLLNDPSREHSWIDDEAQLAIAEELWARGAKANISKLPWGADIGPLMANLGPADTANLLATSCSGPGSERPCGQGTLVLGADKAIERSNTDHLTALLGEPSITALVRVTAALELVRRGEALPSGFVTKECVTQVLAHQCRWSGSGRREAIELLGELLSDQRFGWAEDVLAETASVQAVLALARNGRVNAARAPFDRVLAESSEYGMELLPLLEADLDLTEPEVVEILQRTHHSGDPVDKEDDDRIYRALCRLPRSARRAVWNYAAPDGQVRMYVEAGYVIEKRMLHEVLSPDELKDTVRSARTTERAMHLLRAVLRASPSDARSLAGEIADNGWEKHVAGCDSHMSCRLVEGLSDLFPAGIREQVTIHGEGLKLIATGRYDLIQQWRPSQTLVGLAHPHLPVARALAAAAEGDTAALERLKELAMIHDDYEAALTEVNPIVGRSVMEFRVLSEAVVMDDNRAYPLLKVRSPLALDWYSRAIAESVRTSTPWLGVGDINAETTRAFILRLLQEWISRTDPESTANLAIAMYDVWRRWGESLTEEGTEEIRGALAPHAQGIAASLASLAAATAVEREGESPQKPGT